MKTKIYPYDRRARGGQGEDASSQRSASAVTQTRPKFGRLWVILDAVAIRFKDGSTRRATILSVSDTQTRDESGRLKMASILRNVADVSMVTLGFQMVATYRPYNILTRAGVHTLHQIGFLFQKKD
jgi:hypothetical protein